MTAADPSLSSIRRVLIVRPSALGDVARTVPALATLRHALPEAKIDWLVAQAYKDVLRHHPALNSVIPFDRKRFGKLWWNPAAAGEAFAFCRNLHAANYDLVIDLQGLMRSGIFTRCTGAPRRIGFANAREGAAMAYTEKHHLDTQLHTVDRMLGLLAAAGFTPQHDMRLYAGEENRAWVDAYLAANASSDTPLACIAPTAQWRCKCWPLERYIELTRRLLEMDAVGRRVVIIAAPGEQAFIQPLIDAFAGNAAVLWPRMHVGQMLAMLSRAAIVVCNDSGPLHMAVGVDRPIVSIFGPTDPAVVGPYRRLETVVSPGPVDLPTQQYFRHHREDQSLISRVTMDQVWNKLEEQLSIKR